MSGNGRGSSPDLFAIATTVPSLIRNTFAPNTTPVPSRPVFYPGVNTTEWRKGALDDGLVQSRANMPIDMLNGANLTRKWKPLHAGGKHCKVHTTGMSAFAAQIDLPLYAALCVLTSSFHARF